MSNVHSFPSSLLQRPIQRELLWDESETVLIKIPMNGTIGEYPSSSGAKQFLQFRQNVKGGVVNVHYHDSNLLSFFGKKVIVRPEIWMKTNSDGRKFLYVDLYPVPTQSLKPTHRLTVLNCGIDEIVEDKDFCIFETPLPLIGAVVIMPFDSKIYKKERW